MSSEEKKKGLSVMTSEYELEGRIPTGKAIILGMQHVLAQMPAFVGYIFGGSGIVPAAICSIILNIVLKNDPDEPEVEPLWD